MTDALTTEIGNIKDNFKQCKIDKKEDIDEVKKDLKDFMNENKISRRGIHVKIEASEEAINDRTDKYINGIKDTLEGWKKSIFKIGLRLVIIIITGLFAAVVWLLNFFLPALLEKIQSINIGG